MVQIESLHRVIWGSENKFINDGSNRVVNQWLEAHLEWSEREPFALVQRQGGPCSILAPLQAYIVSVLKDKIEQLEDETATFSTILSNPDITSDLSSTTPSNVSNSASASNLTTSAQNPSTSESVNATNSALNTCTVSRSALNREEILNLAVIKIFENFVNPPQLLQEITSSGEVQLSNEDIKNWCKRLFCPGGLLLFLYSCVFTKTPQAIEQEIGFLVDNIQLIEPVHGHGEQSMLNLLLFGVATSNVFDGIRDLGGLIMTGLENRSKIGFLSLHEAYKSLEVGDNLKNPIYPIWVLSSETHFTVLWTDGKKMTNEDMETVSKRQKLKQNLLQFEQDGGGFFKTEELKNVMASCELMSEEEYINFVKSELDSDDLGIIMINKFLDYFGETDGDSGQNLVQPCSFEIYHYNGRVQSNFQENVAFRKGRAQIVDFMDTGFASNNLEQILQTKWKSIMMEWDPVINEDGKEMDFMPKDY